MTFNIFRSFFKNAHPEAPRLTNQAHDHETSDMIHLIVEARNKKIPTASHFPDDSDTKISAGVTHYLLNNDPESAARMALANPILG